MVPSDLRKDLLGGPRGWSLQNRRSWFKREVCAKQPKGGLCKAASREDKEKRGEEKPFDLDRVVQNDVNVRTIRTFISIRPLKLNRTINNTRERSDRLNLLFSIGLSNFDRTVHKKGGRGHWSGTRKVSNNPSTKAQIISSFVNQSNPKVNYSSA